MIIEKICRSTSLNQKDIELIARTAGRRYKVFEIEKKTGGKRLIEHPSRPVKFLQRWLDRHIFSLLPMHQCAMAYREGRSIAHNARQHVDSRFLLRLDFLNFFPSIKGKHLKAFLVSRRSFLPDWISESDIDIIINIVTRHGGLVIGAPSSPVISNAVMFDIDTNLYEFCARIGIKYTRYADDLFFSTSDHNCLPTNIDKISKIVFHDPILKLVINQKKTILTSSKHRRIVTGLNITPDKKISVGRDKKREIKSLIYKYQIGNLEPDRLSYLCGCIAYLSSVEPTFLESIREKYGQELIYNLLHQRVGLRE